MRIDMKIEEGLECCISDEPGCKLCPYRDKENCSVQLKSDIRNRINSLKAKNKKLNQSDKGKKDCTIEQHAEIRGGRMNYEKCCRNCEYAYLSPRECKGCETFGDKKYENFKLREEFAKIENGTMVELPCKVGDTVYDLWKDNNGEYRISDKEVYAFQIFEDGGVVIDTGTWYPEYINTYLTKEEAEAQLRELKGEVK